jgi:hypothetical protein
MSDLIPILAPPPLCPACESSRTVRVRRKGLMQSLVWHRFGLFPWECTTCRKVFMFKNRGKLKSRRRPMGEIRLPPVN